MDYFTVFFILLGILFFLLFIGQKVCFALAITSVIGFVIIKNPGALQSGGMVAWNAVNSFELIAIPMFILMGELVVHCGLSKNFYKSAKVYFSHIPGGFLQTNILACAIFSAISGSSLACAASIGSVSYRDLSEQGYDKKMVLGTLGGGGALGIMIPPSLPFLIYGSLTDTSVSKLFIAGVIPGLILTLLFMVYVGIRVTINPKLAPKNKYHATRKELIQAIPGMFPFIFLIIVILGGIYSGITTPTEAAAVSVIVALILSAITGGLTWQSVKESLLETIKSYCMIAFIVIGAKFFTYIITMSGVSRGITSWFTSLNASPLAFFLFIIAIYLVLGCLMDGTSIIYLTIPVVYPLIQLAGFDPIWFGVILTALVEIAMLTPPVGMNLFVLHGITKGTCEFKDIIKGCFPYILIYALLIALLWCFPSIATWLPHSM